MDKTLNKVRGIIAGTNEPSYKPLMYTERVENTIANKWYNTDLNDLQKEIIVDVLKTEDIALIHGPPGTGKTTTLVELIMKACLNTNAKVLCCAPSNVAVDNLAEKLIKAEENVNLVRIGNPSRIHENLQKFSLGYLARQILSDDFYETKAEMENMMKQLFTCRSAHSRKAIKRRIERKLEQLEEHKDEAYFEVLDNSQVILCTITSAGCDTIEKYAQKFENSPFDVVIIDE